jgi:hypothetical protein
MGVLSVPLHRLQQKHAAYGIGLRVTRHPRMGAVEQPWVAVREPSWNQAVSGKTGLAGCSTATLKLSKGNTKKTKPLSVRGRIPSAPASVKAGEHGEVWGGNSKGGIICSSDEAATAIDV